MVSSTLMIYPVSSPECTVHDPNRNNKQRFTLMVYRLEYQCVLLTFFTRYILTSLYIQELLFIYVIISAIFFFRMGQNLNKGWNYFMDILFVEAQLMVASYAMNISITEADQLLYPLTTSNIIQTSTSEKDIESIDQT